MRLITAFDEMVSTLRPYFKRSETFERARSLAFSSLVTYGRHTITRLICSKNDQQADWSADYKFFSLRQWDAQDFFLEVLKECDRHSCWSDDAVLVALDETFRRKTGTKIPGVATLRDPMSLPYHVNLVPGLRYLQAAAVITPEERMETYRAIPIYFQEAAPAKKPKKNASKEIKEHYEKRRKEKRISVQGHQAVEVLRRQVDQLRRGKERMLLVTVDGSFCNRNFLRGLPEGVVPIARARKDIKLFKPADDPIHGRRGRRRMYGDRLPTPEEIRKDETYPWAEARIFGAGEYHNVRYKTVVPVLWQRGTGAQPGRLIVIAPLRYRKSATSKLLYRGPAYLFILDVTIPVEHLLQYYFFRWDIEVNHRDEKSLLGVGDAQVRAPESVVRNPQFSVAMYSFLLLASIRAYGAERSEEYLPLPKWRKVSQRRPSTLDILSQFRREIMVAQLDMDFQQKAKSMEMNKKKRTRSRSYTKTKKSSFTIDTQQGQTVLKIPVNIISAMLYADT